MTEKSEDQVIWICINGKFLGDFIYSREKPQSPNPLDEVKETLYSRIWWWLTNERPVEIARAHSDEEVRVRQNETIFIRDQIVKFWESDKYK